MNGDQGLEPGDDEWPGGPDPAYNTIPLLIFWTPSLAPTGITAPGAAAVILTATVIVVAHLTFLPIILRGP